MGNGTMPENSKFKIQNSKLPRAGYTAAASSPPPPAPAQVLARACPLPRGAGASRSWDALYGGLCLAGLPFVLARRFGKDRDGWREKWGHVAERAPHPQRIWIHAVSVGEAVAARSLVQELQAQCPAAEVVLSTSTRTGQEVARQRYGAERVFYFPYDFSTSVRRSFERVKPSLLVLMELEVWPNVTAEAVARGVPVLVVNGRISERSFGRYRSATWLLGGSFRRVHRWLMQNEEYARRVERLGVEAERVEVAGNVKYDAVDTAPLTLQARAEARADLGLSADAPVLMGGSTHPSEETALLDACRQLQERFPGLRLVLAPRHPERLSEVEREITARGLVCLRRSAQKSAGAPAPESSAQDPRASAVVLVDTMGELNRLYRAADVAFVGGSLIPHGGQNVMEPAGLGLPAVYGPHMANFAEAVLILKECEGGVQVEDGAALTVALQNLFSDPRQAQALGQRARAAFLSRQGATAKCVAHVKRLLPPQVP